MIDTSSPTELSDTTQPDTSDQTILLSAAKGGGILFSGKLFAYGSRLIIVFLLARFLGAEQFGLYKIAQPVAAIAAGLAMLGLGNALIRYLSLFLGRRDIPGVWGTLQVGIGIAAALGLLIGGGLYNLADPIATRFFDEPRLVILLQIAGLTVPLLVLNKTIAAATRGFNKMQYTVISRQISQPVIRLVLILILGFVGLNAILAMTVDFLAIFISFVMLVYFLNRLFPLKRPLRAARREIKEILRFSLPVYLSKLISTFGGNIQILILGAWQTVTTVGIFAVANQVSLLGTMFHEAIVLTSMPIFSQLYDQKAWAQMAQFYQTMTKWTFTLNLPLFLVVILFPEPILAIFGQDFVAGATVLSILALRSLVNAGTGICGVVLNMTGHTTLKLVNSIVRFVLALGLNLLFIPLWGLMGAAIAALAVIVIANLLPLLEVYFLYRLLPYHISFFKPVVAGLVTLMVGWTMPQWLPAGENLIYLILNIIILLVVYTGTLLLLGLSQEDRLVLNRLRRRMNATLFKN